MMDQMPRNSKQIFTGYGGSMGKIDYDIGFLYYYYPEEDADEPGSV